MSHDVTAAVVSPKVTQEIADWLASVGPDTFMEAETPPLELPIASVQRVGDDWQIHGQNNTSVYFEWEGEALDEGGRLKKEFMDLAWGAIQDVLDEYNDLGDEE